MEAYIINVTENTKLKEIKSAYPNFIEVGARQYPALEKLSGGFVWMMAKNLTVAEAAAKAKMSTSEMLEKIRDVIRQC